MSSRLAEDTAVEGLAVRRHDYVLLGAGLDTFGWRHPEAGRFRIWEIDRPATQRWKRRALERPATEQVLTASARRGTGTTLVVNSRQLAHAGSAAAVGTLSGVAAMMRGGRMRLRRARCPNRRGG